MTDKKVFDWKTQLAIGEEGERIFAEHYHDKPLTKIEAHYADFKTKEGEVLELKTDTYPMSKTPNFYFERYSDMKKKSPGGIWQSMDKGVQVFCYFFKSDGVYFEFRDMPALKQCVEDYIRDKSYVIIRNKGYSSQGYKIPRSLLNHLWKSYTIKPTEE